MKNFLFLTAGLLLAGTAASAQVSPSTPQYGGAVNQTTVTPANPANPATNPGTLDQRTPTTTVPTQTGVPGTIDQRPATTPVLTPGNVRRSTAPGAPRRANGTLNRTNTNGTLNRTNSNGTMNRPAGTTTTPTGTVRP